MSEWENFIAVFKGPRSDVVVMLATFLLTVLVDLTVAIEIGMVLAVFLFMQKMIRFSEVNILTTQTEEGKTDTESLDQFQLPKDVEVFEITGPLFFGAAYKFKDAIRLIEQKPKVLIIRMRQVPIIDATGIKTLEEVNRECRHRGTRVILSEIHSEQVYRELKDARLIFAIGKANVKDRFISAIERSKQLLAG